MVVGSWTVCGGISADGKAEACLCVWATSACTKPYSYVEPRAIPYAHFLGNSFIFVHDNTRAHTASVVRDYVTKVGISCLKQPERTPDKKSIKNLCDELKTLVQVILTQKYLDKQLQMQSKRNGMECNTTFDRNSRPIDIQPYGSSNKNSGREYELLNRYFFTFFI